MSKCDRAKRIADLLKEMTHDFEYLKNLVNEQEADENPKEKRLREKARKCSVAMYDFDAMKPVGEHARARLIEALLHEEIEACAVTLEENGYISSNPATIAVRARLDR